MASPDHYKTRPGISDTFGLEAGHKYTAITFGPKCLYNNLGGEQEDKLACCATGDEEWPSQTITMHSLLKHAWNEVSS